ncbi:hypothetical protein HCQ94_05945 [Actinomyces sp. zg-332]|uniref:hypothetical protein n=1 Tax=Actinomyces sp. zg-332 TaxID=2708340 RepID=UPI00141FF10E|nr:hypothetical protein [Actinomyces sp. zg-332]QPK94100.1 hypothetical protein HCQ94_05945 [Actinomyces sp. zg-332]
MNKVISCVVKKNYLFVYKIKLFIKRHLKAFSKANYAHEKGSITLESALVMPVVVLAICIILLAINISINYLKIQDMAHSCATIIKNNTPIHECLKLPKSFGDEQVKIQTNSKNQYTEILVSKKIFLFPNISPINLRTKSIVYKE